MKRIILPLLIIAISTIANTAFANATCNIENGYDEINAFSQIIVDNAIVTDSLISPFLLQWNEEDLELLINMIISNGENYLMDCYDAEDNSALDDWATASQINISFPTSIPISVELGYPTQAQTLDLNGDGQDELILNLQVPFINQFDNLSGVSIVFTLRENNWVGQAIAPVTFYVTNTSNDERSYPTYTMNESYSFAVDTLTEALIFTPETDISVFNPDGSESTLISVVQYMTTRIGYIRMLNILDWNNGNPQILLQIMYDSWCFGSIWQIHETGDVFLPSNRGNPDSSVHCGRTPELLFSWDGERYLTIEEP